MKQDPKATLTNTLNSLPHLFFNEAVESAKKGDLSGARDKLSTVLSLDPAMTDAHVVLGKIYAQMGDYDAAIDCWKTALHFAPDSDAAQSGIARARALQKQAAKVRTRGRLLRAALSVALFLLGGTALYGYQSMSLKPSPVPLNSIRAALHDNPALRNADLKVIAKDNRIEISGRVPTRMVKDLVLVLAENKAQGSTLDISNVRVAHLQPLAESFKRLLKDLDPADAGSIKVTEKDGALYLAGNVETDSEKHRLTTLAHVLIGVRKVDAGKLKSLGIRKYIFRPGDTLWDIALRFYGDGSQWKKILKSNPQLPSDPRKVRIGAQVMIYPRGQ